MWYWPQGLRGPGTKPSEVEVFPVELYEFLHQAPLEYIPRGRKKTLIVAAIKADKLIFDAQSGVCGSLDANMKRGKVVIRSWLAAALETADFDLVSPSTLLQTFFRRAP